MAETGRVDIALEEVHVAPLEMECPVCFNSYECFVRKPKVLACQHGFCAICLKIILVEKDGCWVVPCPLCRRFTLALEASVANLPDNARVMELLSGKACPVPESVPELLLVPHLLLPAEDAGGEATEVVEIAAYPDSQAGQSETILTGCTEYATKRFLLTLIFFLILFLSIQYFIKSSSLLWVTVVLGSLGSLITIILLYICCQKRGLRLTRASCHCDCLCCPCHQPMTPSPDLE